jgi:membrane-bound lytic murein transglycosylase MltF
MLTLVPEGLEDEDMMEMVNAALFEAVVVKDWLAKMWAQILPKIRVHSGIPLRSDEHIGWATRKGSPKLDGEIRDFFQNYVVKRRVIEARLATYMKRIKQIKDPTRTAEWRRFEQTIASCSSRRAIRSLCSTRTRGVMSAPSESCNSCRLPAPR